MLALACALALLLTACNEGARPQPSEGAAEIWFAVGVGEDGGPLADGGGAVAPEYRALPDEADPVEERMAALLSGPQSAELRSPFHPGCGCAPGGWRRACCGWTCRRPTAVCPAWT